jgi:hypothetical protein
MLLRDLQQNRSSGLNWPVWAPQRGCIITGLTVNLCSMEAAEVKPLRPPEGLGSAGRALWRDTVANYTFTTTELALLRELCRATDTATRLTTHAKGVSVTVKGSRNQPIVHPVFAEIRATQETIARLSRALNLPDDRRNQGKRRIKSQPRINRIEAQQARRLPAVVAMTDRDQQRSGAAQIAYSDPDRWKREPGADSA